MAAVCLDMVARCYPQQHLPFSGDSACARWFALLDLSDVENEAHARERFEAVLGDAALAREITLAQAESGKSIKHDVSLPISRIPDFVASTDAALQARFLGLVSTTFGHLGQRQPALQHRHFGAL